MDLGLKDRVTRALKTDTTLSAADLNKLLQDLALSQETAALIRIWDIRGKTCIHPETMKVMKELHDLGKGKIPIGTIIMTSDRTRLPAPRRLHKIFKGQVMSARSDEANKYIPEAMKYVLEHPELKSLKRGDQVKAIKCDLKVSNDAARGLVTKLKQKKLL
jgi:hypothetical protein